MAEPVKMYSAKQVASRIGTDAKHLRKFFRDENSGYEPVGQGGRYDFPETEIPKIEQAFKAWNSTKTRRNRQPAAKRTPSTASGLIPSPRQETPKRTRNLDQGLHGNALDDDTLQDRFAGIAARMEKHGLTTKQGRFVQQDKVHNPHPPKDEIPGLINTPEPQILDFSEDEVRGPSDEELLALMEEIADEEE